LKNLLNENGRILIQIINYSVIPKNEEYILNKFENEEISIIRKYHFNKNEIDFLIDLVDKRENKSQQILTKIYPHTLEDFEKLAEYNSLKINVYGNLNKGSFKNISKDFVICLTK